MISIEQTFYEATEVEVSSRWRIANLVKNAKHSNTVVKSNSVEFSCFIDSRNTMKCVYSVPVLFLSNSQLTYLQSIISKKI